MSSAATTHNTTALRRLAQFFADWLRSKQCAAYQRRWPSPQPSSRGRESKTGSMVGQRKNALALLAATAVLAGCASVSPDGLRGDVQTLIGQRSGVANAALPSTDAATRAQAQNAMRGWLA